MLKISANVVEGPYFQDLMAQPYALDSTLAYLSEPGRWNTVGKFLGSRPWKRVVLTGMGSSFHSLNTLQLALFQSQQTPVLMETSELVHYGSDLFDPQTLVVVVSQSGRSAETLRLLECNRTSPVLAVTNTADSPLAAACNCLLLICAGIESSVSCKTYLAGLMVLAWVAEMMRGGSEKETLARLAPASGAVAAYMRNWRTHTQALYEQFAATRHLFLVGRGTSLAAAGTGALIIKESARFHAEGMSSAAFRHGPMEMLRSDIQTVVFRGDPRTHNLNDRLVRDLVAKSGRCSEISEASTSQPFRLAPCESILRPVLEILPVQLLSLALAALAGQEAGRFEHASKITATE
jgi:glucosamine--fructose-6-phosphate aminotransferase (isomerizing)